jgi:hypothetical protein
MPLEKYVAAETIDNSTLYEPLTGEWDSGVPAEVVCGEDMNI